MVALESSAILRFWYQPTSATLFVTFVTGRTYAYEAVPAQVYAAFCNAESYGRFFNAHIRDRYRYRLLRG
jgi:hypothetical protein